MLAGVAVMAKNCHLTRYNRSVPSVYQAPLERAAKLMEQDFVSFTITT